MTHAFELTVSPTDGASNIYLEVAAGVTMFLLAGRYFEKRSKRQAGAALRALLELGAKDVAVLRDGSRGPHPHRRAGRRRRVRRAPRARRSPPTASSSTGTSAVDASMLTGESVPVEVGDGDPVVGATVNAGGRLVVRATRVGADTQLAQMAKLVEDAQSGKAAGAATRRPGLRRSSCRSCIALAVATLAAWLGAGSRPRPPSPRPSRS